MNVIFVRHGESTNNVVAGELKRAFFDPHNDAVDLAAFEKEWLARRKDDPPMSEQGHAQAEAVAAAIAPTVLSSHDRGCAEVCPQHSAQVCRICPQIVSSFTTVWRLIVRGSNNVRLSCVAGRHWRKDFREPFSSYTANSCTDFQGPR